MTVEEFINAYRSCAINGIPQSEISNVLEVARSHTRSMEEFEKVVAAARGNHYAKYNLRFINGAFANWMTVAPYSIRQREFGLDAAIHFAELTPNNQTDISFSRLDDIL